MSGPLCSHICSPAPQHRSGCAPNPLSSTCQQDLVFFLQVQEMGLRGTSGMWEAGHLAGTHPLHLTSSGLLQAEPVLGPLCFGQQQLHGQGHQKWGEEAAWGRAPGAGPLERDRDRGTHPPTGTRRHKCREEAHSNWACGTASVTQEPAQLLFSVLCTNELI